MAPSHLLLQALQCSSNQDQSREGGLDNIQSLEERCETAEQMMDWQRVALDKQLQVHEHIAVPPDAVPVLVQCWQAQVHASLRRGHHQVSASPWCLHSVLLN